MMYVCRHASTDATKDNISNAINNASYCIICHTKEADGKDLKAIMTSNEMNIILIES
jgi:hypothetical protein